MKRYKLADPAYLKANVGDHIRGALLLGARTIPELQSMIPWAPPENVAGAVLELLDGGEVVESHDQEEGIEL